MKGKIKALLGGATLALFISAACAAQDMRTFTKDSLKQIVAEQKGKPFVLVVWSLDCSFCQTSLENLAAERSRGRKLRIVTLSTDSITDGETMSASMKRLRALGLNGNAWAFDDQPAEVLRYALDPGWHGEKPRSYWIDVKGEKKAYSGLITPTLINEFLGTR